jgi:hypothetical protein
MPPVFLQYFCFHHCLLPALRSPLGTKKGPRSFSRDFRGYLMLCLFLPHNQPKNRAYTNQGICPLTADSKANVFLPFILLSPYSVLQPFVIFVHKACL